MDQVENTLTKDVVETHYKAKLEEPGSEWNMDGYAFGGKLAIYDQMTKPITLREVQSAVIRMGNNTSQGPDGVDLSTLKNLDKGSHKLLGLFNAFQLAGEVPKSLKNNKSILLPKCDTGLNEVNNWRPITIGSVILRLFTGITAKRMLKKRTY